jgi:hypothetical protein
MKQSAAIPAMINTKQGIALRTDLAVVALDLVGPAALYFPIYLLTG